MAKKKGLKIGIALLLAASVAAAGFILLGASKEEKEPPPIQREYVANMGDITVGVDASGKISVPGVDHTFSKDTVINEVLVKAGDVVKKGDPLAKLSADQTAKNKKNFQDSYDKLKEELKEVEKDRQNYLTDMSWKLENEKDDSSEAYWDRYYEIENERWSLEDELSSAKWKKNNWNDDELINATIEKLEKEIAGRRTQLEEHKASREKEKEQESDLAFQKERQEKKIAEYDQKIEALKKEMEAVSVRLEAAQSGILVAENHGIVLKINYTKGQSVEDGKPVAVVGDTEKILLLLNIEPENIVDVVEGQSVIFYTDAYPDQAIRGTIRERILVPNTDGKFGAVVEVEKTDLEMLDGMTASAVIVLKQKEGVLTLQNKAISNEGGKPYVNMRGADGALIKTEITTGFSDGRVTEILTGLKDGDTVICEG